MLIMQQMMDSWYRSLFFEKPFNKLTNVKFYMTDVVHNDNVVIRMHCDQGNKFCVIEPLRFQPAELCDEIGRIMHAMADEFVEDDYAAVVRSKESWKQTCRFLGGLGNVFYQIMTKTEYSGYARGLMLELD